MASELTFNISTTSRINGIQEGSSNTCILTQTGTINRQVTQTLSTTAEAADVGDVVAPFWIKVINLDTTNTVTVGTDSTALAKPIGQLPAASGTNLPFLFTRIPTGTTVYAVAGAGTPKIRLEIFPE